MDIPSFPCPINTEWEFGEFPCGCDGKKKNKPVIQSSGLSLLGQSLRRERSGVIDDRTADFFRKLDGLIGGPGIKENDVTGDLTASHNQ